MFDKKFLVQVMDSLGDRPKRNSRILIVDSMNTFIRSFASVNLINVHGNHIGGLSGYLKSVGYAIRLYRPTRVILVFDGLGSTNNKKNLYPDYKGNRNITRITNWDIFDNKEEESEAMVNQMTRLIQYLHQLPVSLVSIDKIEADDSIGFIANYFKAKEECIDVTIMSADKDFYQLIDEKVSVYSPTKKKTYKTADLLEEYGTHPNNFLLYKVLMGDVSDNLPGVRGLGPKKVIKLFPLGDPDEYTLGDMFLLSELNLGKSDMYQKVIEAKHQLDINYQLMDIRRPNISEEDIKEITTSLEEEITPLNSGQFMMLYESDGLGNSIGNPQFWLMEIFGNLILK